MNDPIAMIRADLREVSRVMVALAQSGSPDEPDEPDDEPERGDDGQSEEPEPLPG